MCVCLSHSIVSNSLRLHGLWLTRLIKFSRQEYWSGLLVPSLGDLPIPGMEPRFPPLQADSLPSEPPGKPLHESTETFFQWLYIGKFSGWSLVLFLFILLISFVTVIHFLLLATLSSFDPSVTVLSCSFTASLNPLFLSLCLVVFPLFPTSKTALEVLYFSLYICFLTGLYPVVTLKCIYLLIYPRFKFHALTFPLTFEVYLQC